MKSEFINSVGISCSDVRVKNYLTLHKLAIKPFVMKFSLLAIFSILFINSIFAQDDTHKQKVLGYFQDQQFDEAINYLLPVIQYDSMNVQLLGYLGYAYTMVEQNRTAEIMYERILAIDSNHISANLSLSRLYSQRRPERSQELTARLIRLQPEKDAHYRMMGQLLDRKKEKDSAYYFFETAYRIAPQDPRNAAPLADVLLDTKNYPRADSILAAGLAQDSMYVPFLISAIRSAYETEHYELSIVPGERLMAQQDVTLKPFTQLILSYYMLNRYTDCIDVCQYLRDQEIETEALNYYEAKAWAKLREFERSNALLRTCIESAVSAKAELYYFALADNYEETNQFNRAIAHYDTAYYFFKAPLAKYNVGRIYETKLKNPERANKYFKNYLLIADTSTDDEKKVFWYLHKRYRVKKSGQDGKPEPTR